MCLMALQVRVARSWEENTQRASEVGEQHHPLVATSMPSETLQELFVASASEQDFWGSVWAGKDILDHLTVSPKKGS